MKGEFTLDEAQQLLSPCLSGLHGTQQVVGLQQGKAATQPTTAFFLLSMLVLVTNGNTAF